MKIGLIRRHGDHYETEGLKLYVNAQELSVIEKPLTELLRKWQKVNSVIKYETRKNFNEYMVWDEPTGDAIIQLLYPTIGHIKFEEELHALFKALEIKEQEFSWEWDKPLSV